jgi:hypothetical protein
MDRNMERNKRTARNKDRGNALDHDSPDGRGHSADPDYLSAEPDPERPVQRPEHLAERQPVWL